MADDKKKEVVPVVAAPSQSGLSADVAAAIAAAVGQAIKEALPLAVSAAAQIAAAQVQNVQVVHGQQSAPDSARCSDCKQYTRACKGQHRKAIVFPKNEEYSEWFPGVSINGAFYRSNGPQHLITVPKDCNVEHIVELWEKGERELRHGRKRMHNSGTMGPGGTQVNRATSAGW